jgi:hydroxymethylpyrimidine pyrophosphatase-like HAD family hydrolase
MSSRRSESMRRARERRLHLRIAMRYRALATDYDGTLAEDGKVRSDVLVALKKWKKSGRKLLMVTGRELDDLMQTFPHVDVFDEIVAENGALLYRPSPPRERPLAKAPPPELVEALRARGVGPISCGRIIVATWQPHETVVLEVIRELGLELEVIFNKGAVMVLPSGVNKGTGLRAALVELGLPAESVIGVGDAENDHSLLDACGYGAAVGNAIPALKKRARFVTNAARGQGVAELIEHVMRTDVEEEEKEQPRPPA